MILSFLHIFAAYLLNPACAQDKAQFEQTSQVLVWDSGRLQGQLDAEDDLTDLTAPCRVDEGHQNLASVGNRTSGSPAEVQTLANTLKSSLGISIDVNMNPVMAKRGRPEEPTFFLFPEHHIQENPMASTLLLHKSRAVDMVRITDELVKNNVRLLNADEGPAGTPWIKNLSHFPQESSARLKQIFKSLKSYSMSGAVLIGEAFFPEVQTIYIDDNDLWVRWILTVFANKNISAGVPIDVAWQRTREILIGSSRAQVSHVKIDSYRQFFHNVFRLDSLRLKDLYSELCEQRSQKMAQFTYESAKAHGARIVFMSFGALHTYGIVEQLKKYSSNFIVFSPNFRDSADIKR